VGKQNDHGITWTDRTWNPIAGCSRVSEGCRNCYAERMAGRLASMGLPKYTAVVRHGDSGAPVGRWNGQICVDEAALDAPLHWRKPSMVFVNSMSDLFHPGVPDDVLDDIHMVMESTPCHTYQVLTKRPERALEWYRYQPVPRNVWLGTSVESARHADRIDALRDIIAPVRFLSLEPLLGRFDSLDLTCIHWVIVGGESGPGARPMAAARVRDIRNRCIEAGVPFLFKQWGGVNKKAAGRELDGRTWDQYPSSMEVKS